MSTLLRRPSRINTTPDLRISPAQKNIPSLVVSGPSLYDPPHHRIPWSVRLPSLFRTRISLAAAIPLFLLAYLLFSPFRRLEAEPSHNYPVVSDKGQYDQSIPNQSWTQKFLNKAGYSPAAVPDLTPHEHYTEEDGLLYFPPAAPSNVDDGVEAAYSALPKQRHPILYLIEKAEQDWKELLDRQSTTLQEAVAEYKQRYNRPPPAGFDLWWKFVQDNNVQLPDEYDMIMNDIEPFFSLPPRIFKARSHQLAMDQNFHHHLQSFTVNIKRGQLDITGPLRYAGRAEETKELMEAIAEFLPDMQITFTGHDGPGVVVSGEAKQRHIEYARKGKFLTEKEYTDIDDGADFPGWPSACPPDSNWRRSLFGWSLRRPSTHSFITDVEESANPCRHPNIASQHGFFLWNGPHTDIIYPLFTWAKTALHSDILVTPLEQYHMEVGPDPEWEEKKYNKLLWRGSNTGAAFHRESKWRSSQRCRFVLITNEQEGERTVQWCDKNGLLHATEEPVKTLNERYTDVSFAGRPGQCDEGDGTCEALTRVFNFAGNMGLEEANNYKYIFDMDGNGWSGRFHRLMSSNSAILKSTIMPEWYQQRVMPWVHYIPVKVDYNDLYDILAFFIGGPDGKNGHDHLGQKIAQQGQQWAKEHWREVDMQAYLFRLFLEYGRLLTRSESDLGAGDYVG